MQVNVHEAKTQLSKLIEAALRGEEVVIARRGKAVVRLAPVEERRRGMVLGLFEGEVDVSGIDWFAPLDPEELALWEGGSPTDPIHRTDRDAD